LTQINIGAKNSVVNRDSILVLNGTRCFSMGF